MVRITTFYLSRIRYEHAITSPILSDWNEFLSTDFIARMRRRRGEWCIWHIISTHKHPRYWKSWNLFAQEGKKIRTYKKFTFLRFSIFCFAFFLSMIWFMLLINIWQLFYESEYLVFKKFLLAKISKVKLLIHRRLSYWFNWHLGHLSLSFTSL